MGGFGEGPGDGEDDNNKGVSGSAYITSGTESTGWRGGGTGGFTVKKITNKKVITHKPFQDGILTTIEVSGGKWA